jgi:23S rRNA pseudouridine2604 synthase
LLVRLNKYISQSGLCSRREADRYIEEGKVSVNGKTAGIRVQVAPGDLVVVNGQEIEPRDEEKLIFIALNKPRGIVSTTEGSERANIVDFVGHSIRIFPIGRLDKESQGLIFLTNNGDLVNKILRAGNNHEKEYILTLNKPITDKFIESMSKGVPILGVVTKKCKVTQVSSHVFKITLIQGLNRQIRRMAEYFGYEVTKLDRVRIMNVELKGLSVGDWRDLEPKELEGLFKLIEGSSSEAPKNAKSAKKGPNAQKKSSSKKVTKSSSHRKKTSFSSQKGPQKADRRKKKTRNGRR